MYDFKEENSRESVIECLGLAEAHYKEVEAKSASIPFNLNLDTMCDLAKNNMLALIVARKDGVAVGYMCNLVTVDMMTGVLSASELGIYLDPSVRGGKAFLRLMKATENILRARGVKQHLIMFKAGHDTGLAQRLGYEHTETTYMKLLEA